MIELTSAWIDAHVEGYWVDEIPEIAINSITTDSRKINLGELFIALKGEQFDGHQFIPRVFEHGAGAVICEQPLAGAGPQFVVESSRQALGQLGKALKRQLAPKTVAMTGSSGKTTVKEMCSAIFSQLDSVWATPGNFNNEIGVPLSLLGLSSEHKYGVFELGANHAHEIAYTVDLVAPDCVTILNVSEAHLQGFGSLDGVAKAKSEIYHYAPADCHRIVSLDCPYAEHWLSEMQTIPEQYLTKISTQQPADFYTSDVNLDDAGCARFALHTPDGNTQVALTIPGLHNVANALAAAALCLRAGASLAAVRDGLQSLRPVTGRLCVNQFANITVIDDSYNANVGSVRAAIDVLSQIKQQTVLILGDMAELGSDAMSYHQQVGLYAKQQGIEQLFTLGPLTQHCALAFGDGALHSETFEQLEQRVEKLLTNNSAHTTILVKGSRSTRMERVVKIIESNMLSINTNNNGDISQC